MKACEKCGKTHPNPYGMWDYCAECSRILCDECAKEGCCGHVPMQSGIAEDYPEEDEDAQQ